MHNRANNAVNDNIICQVTKLLQKSQWAYVFSLFVTPLHEML